LLAGKSLFEFSDEQALIDNIFDSDPESPSQRAGVAIPRQLESLVLRCLDKDPNKRPQSTAEVLDELEAMPAMEPWCQEDAKEWWHAFFATSEDDTDSQPFGSHDGGTL
jgi:serine/threonine protein kinase